MPAWKRRHRHQLQMRNPQLHQIIQPLHRRIKCPLRRKRAHMHLVNHRTRKRRRVPSVIAPRKRALVINPRQPMHSMRLPLRPRIRPRPRIPIQHKSVIRPRPSLRYRNPPPPALTRPLHRILLLINLHRHPAHIRRPHPELMHQSFVSRTLAHQKRHRKILQQQLHRDHSTAHHRSRQTILPLALRQHDNRVLPRAIQLQRQPAAPRSQHPRPANRRSHDRTSLPSTSIGV